MAAVRVPLISADDYLRVERAAEFRSEYVAGQIFAMSGGSGKHGALIMACGAELRTGLKGCGCSVYTDVRLQVGANRTAYFYPDVMVVCGETLYFDGCTDLITNPGLVVEVLSPSTEVYDRTRKFALYRQVPSLREYVLVSQDEMRVEWYTRNDAGKWEYQEVSGADGVCQLEVLGVTIPLGEMYEGVVS